VGIGTSITKFGFGGALLAGALSYMVTPSNAQSGYNPINALTDYLGPDSSITKLLGSGAGVGLVGLIGTALMPKAFGGLRGAGMSISGLYMAWGLLQNTLSGDFKDVVELVSDNMDVDFLNRQNRNTAVDVEALTKGLNLSEVPVSATIDASGDFATASPKPTFARLAELAANPMAGSALPDASVTAILANAEHAALEHVGPAKRLVGGVKAVQSTVPLLNAQDNDILLADRHGVAGGLTGELPANEGPEHATLENDEIN